MKILFVSIILALAVHAQAVEKPYIISGFDDVLRQSENTGLFNAAIKLFAKDETFKIGRAHV